MSERRPYIVCCGATAGLCVIYGYMDEAPVHGHPARVHDARMILRFGSGGLLGIAGRGPLDGCRITSSVPETGTSTVHEWIAVAPEAAEKIDQWPAAS